MALVAEWISLGEMTKLPELSTLISDVLRAWQDKETMDSLRDQIWNEMNEEWAEHVRGERNSMDRPGCVPTRCRLSSHLNCSLLPCPSVRKACCTSRSRSPTLCFTVTHKRRKSCRGLLFRKAWRRLRDCFCAKPLESTYSVRHIFLELRI